MFGGVCTCNMDVNESSKPIIDMTNMTDMANIDRLNRCYFKFFYRVQREL